MRQYHRNWFRCYLCFNPRQLRGVLSSLSVKRKRCGLDRQVSLKWLTQSTPSHRKSEVQAKAMVDRQRPPFLRSLISHYIIAISLKALMTRYKSASRLRPLVSCEKWREMVFCQSLWLRLSFLWANWISEKIMANQSPKVTKI